MFGVLFYTVQKCAVFCGPGVGARAKLSRKAKSCPELLFDVPNFEVLEGNVLGKKLWAVIVVQQQSESSTFPFFPV